MNYILASVPATHYTGELAQYAAEEEEFPGLAGDGVGVISGVSVKSIDNLDWQVELWDSDDNVVAAQSFTATTATQQDIDGTLYYFYPVADINWTIPVTCPKRTVTIALRNLSTNPKTAGTAGAVTILLNVAKY